MMNFSVPLSFSIHPHPHIFIQATRLTLARLQSLESSPWAPQRPALLSMTRWVYVSHEETVWMNADPPSRNSGECTSSALCMCITTILILPGLPSSYWRVNASFDSVMSAWVICLLYIGRNGQKNAYTVCHRLWGAGTIQLYFYYNVGAVFYP